MNRNIRMIRTLCKAMIAALILLAAAMACLPGTAEEMVISDVKAHNYILVIDNSRSTTGRHSLGSATDPQGLRFDAARLVYENVLSTAATGGHGQIGVIVFCGPENCVSYGPMAIDGDPEALARAIGDGLNEAANANRRDMYTDIATALETARGMMESFDENSDTAVILLTDGVNDLTNKSDPFNAPENIAANDRSVELVQQIREAGAAFYVVALTAPDAITGTDAFMVFINRLAEAGGGKLHKDGVYSNVLSATDADLNSKLLQMLVRAETATEAVQTFIEYTPLEETFIVPYSGITDATINITFMPEDKARLSAVDLVSPSGVRYAMWDSTGVLDDPDALRDRVGAMESRSYIMMTVPSPEAGRWKVIVKSRADADRVLINAVLRLNHNMRLTLDMHSVYQAGDKAAAEAWFQRYDGENYVDMFDSDIYRQSQANLMLYGPDLDPGSTVPSMVIPMAQKDGRYRAAFTAVDPGIWTAKLTVENDYLSETVDFIAFEVALAPTPTPSSTPTPTPEPTPTPTPVVAEIEDIRMDTGAMLVNPEGALFVDAAAGEVALSWSVDGDTDYVKADLLEDGAPLAEDIEQGYALDPARMKPDSEYALRITAMPKNGALAGVEPTEQSVSFRLAPEVTEIGGIAITVEPMMPETGEDGMIYVDRDADSIAISWTIDGETDSVEAALETEIDGEPTTVQKLTSGEGVPRDMFEDGNTYTARVSAVPKNGALLGVAPVQEALEFQLYPKAQPIEGLTLTFPEARERKGVYRFEGNVANLGWRFNSGNVDRYVVKVTDSKGQLIDAAPLDGSARLYSVTLPKNDDYTVELTAVPAYARNDSLNAVALLTIRPHIKNIFEKYWYFFLAGAVVLAAVIGLIIFKLIHRKEKVNYVTGMLHVSCEALEFDQVLRFSDAKGKAKVKEGDPITFHPELANLKGEAAYQLLTRVRLKMARADASGKVEGERGGALHQPKSSLIALQVIRPTGAKELRCVGANEMEPVVIELKDVDEPYEFLFWGSENPQPKKPDPEPEPPVEEVTAEEETPVEEKNPTEEETPAEEEIPTEEQPEGETQESEGGDYAIDYEAYFRKFYGSDDEERKPDEE